MPKQNKTACKRRKCQRRCSQNQKRKNNNRRIGDIRGGFSPLQRFSEWNATRRADAEARRSITSTNYRRATIRSPIRMWREWRQRNGNTVAVEPARVPPPPSYPTSTHFIRRRNPSPPPNAPPITPISPQISPPIRRISPSPPQHTNLPGFVSGDLPPAGKKPAVPLPSAGKKQINITRTTLSPYQVQLLLGIVASERESDHIQYAARELLKGEESAFFIQTFNQMIDCVFIGSDRVEGRVRRPQSTGDWGLNYDFTVKYIGGQITATGASKYHTLKVAQLIEGVNYPDKDSKVNSLKALFPIYMTLRREFACATTLETMTPPYKFKLEERYAILSLIKMIEDRVQPESLAAAMDLATYQKFGSVDRVNAISESSQPIYNRFLQYAEYLNRIL